ncbi:tetratricopeptide repeat protein, partial [Limnospira fusiformis]|uniref:tetratricopeptide repeat protein n=1 Tax=Limnospira fusiformis TaxID=54297 RepID=UPI002AA206BA|nr:tetratricopeptide repeat protein [Limnospira fusiformis LS22]
VWGARVIVDIDDEELIFVKASETLDLRELPPLRDLDSQEWTEMAAGLAREFDKVRELDGSESGELLADVVAEVLAVPGCGVSRGLGWLLAGLPSVESVWSELGDKGRVEQVWANDGSDSYFAHHRLGEALEELGRFDEAIEAYRRSLELQPESTGSVFSLSRVLRRVGRVEDAKRVQEKSIKIDSFVDDSVVANSDISPIDEYTMVFVGIASIPQRVDSLKLTIESLINQVDKIGVFLDKYHVVPEYLKNYGERIEVVTSNQVDRDLGDAGKFFWVESHQGYYFTCDDDLIYPPDYIFRTISRIKSFGTPVVLGWHGSLIISPFTDYYDPKSRRVFTFSAPRPFESYVHILGTGCLGFHTSHICVKLSDFKTPNMADVYFSLLGQKQKVPFIVIKHLKGEIIEAENSQDISIWKHSSCNIEMSRQNTKAIQNRLVSQIDWKINYANRRLRILVVGRFRVNRKGGVFKSSQLLVEGLTQLGHEVKEVCISQSHEISLFIDEYANHPLDFALFYLPDPERPDFGNVIKQVELLASRGCVCAVNFSINLDPGRSKWISEKVRELNANFNYPRIFIAAFTNSTSLIKELDDVKDYIVTFPKTIDPGKIIKSYPYIERKDIFLGDIAKLCNNQLAVPNVTKWIEQIRINLPHVNIYAIKHYYTKAKLPDYIKILPYSQKGLGEILTQFRLYVCLTPGATFEMIPVEAAMAGTPVIHSPMPQSLSEYLSPVSIEVKSPEELGKMCLTIYEREDLWCRLSAASKGIHQTSYVDYVIAVIELSIRKCLLRAGFP